VAGQQPTANTVPPKAERRRSQRVLLVIPMEVTWTTKEGVRVKEHAETEEVNACGAVLRMKAHPPISTEVELTHGRTHESVRARVVGMRDPTTEGLKRIGVDLAPLSETFWGVSIPTLPSARRS